MVKKKKFFFDLCLFAIPINCIWEHMVFPLFCPFRLSGAKESGVLTKARFPLRRGGGGRAQ